MLGFIKNLFKKPSESVLGIDIGPSSIKVVQLSRKKGRAVLDTYGALALGPYAGIEIGRSTNLPPEKIAEALVDVLRESGTTTKQCGLSIPMSSSLLTLIEVPAANEAQLDQIIPIEARKYIPLPISEVALDWWVVPQEQVGIATEFDSGQKAPGTPATIPKITVLLVVIHNEALARAQEIIRLANLDASFFEIEIFSTIRSVLEHESAPVMIFDMGAGSTKLYIVDRGILRLSHIVTRGSQDMTLAISKSLNISVEEAESLKRERGVSPAAKPGMPGAAPTAAESASLAAVTPEQLAQIMLPTLNYIFSEANRVLFNYQKKYNKNVAKVVLTGGGAALKGFADIAKKEMQTAVESANPFAKTDAPAFLQQLLAQSGPEFSVSIGLALRRLQELK